MKQVMTIDYRLYIYIFSSNQDLDGRCKVTKALSLPSHLIFLQNRFSAQKKVCGVADHCVKVFRTCGVNLCRATSSQVIVLLDLLPTRSNM